MAETVLFLDRRFGTRKPYAEAIRDAGGTVRESDAETEADRIEECRDATVVVTTTTPVTAPMLESATDLRLAFRNGAGYDTIDVAAANRLGVAVSALRGYMNDELAEHAIALLLAVARDVAYCDRQMRSEPGWGDRTYVRSVAGETVGIVGFGQVGRTFAEKAAALGLEVIAFDPYVPSDLFDRLGVERVGFDELLSRADAVSIHCQLTAETHHLFDEQALERLDDDAILINTARGPVVDEDALVAAVTEDRLAGAGLDVFETEPPEGAVLSCEGIVCSPHHGGDTVETTERAIEMGRDEISRALCGKRLRHVVNPEVIKHEEGFTVGRGTYDSP
ncbi:NAD(P)-dependent oxidoreductase [Natrarchaeobius oligotrophus]|uniref:C-terminal binding protein n=1 Tax=Natrarchaeobius chitinivorans TaxID=1679083 RepID=A0A3N6M744_NATCH|nr:NAD(P)-dependent oxidoreductase [Natrarchaeobius chitinivorans]RQG99443.1 C-terminal binding protein [Natrarchaeobius chitinivorans]